jgi:outer membrane protein TolC
MKLVGLPLILLFAFTFGTFSVQAQETLRLEDAIQQGLQNQFAIQIAKKREKIAENDNTLGNAGFLPTINGTTAKNYAISGLNQEFFGGIRAPLNQSGVRSNSSNAGVAMAWTLYDGNGMFILKNRFSELQQLGAKQTETSIENLIALISTTYYDIIRQ